MFGGFGRLPSISNMLYNRSRSKCYPPRLFPRVTNPNPPGSDGRSTEGLFHGRVCLIKACSMNVNLLDAILLHLRQTPCGLLRELALELRVSQRTIESSVHLGTGKTFRDLRKEILVARVRNILASHPTMAVKELSFSVGFKSPSSFSRAIKRACGSCPQELRSRVAHKSASAVSVSS